jgi:calreticulin
VSKTFEEKHLTSPPKIKSDSGTHLYTLIVRPDNKFEIKIDNEVARKGSLLEDFSPSVNPPKMIDDPNDKKPEDWVDDEFIPDPEASKPEDWDEEEDGEWEAPKIENPEYKGEWSPKMIPNPEYKGEWKAPMIDNPDYEYDENVGKYDDLEYVGIEIWQVKAGTIFDHILVTDNVDEAKDEMEKILNDAKEEKQKFEKAEEEKKQEQQKKAEEEEAERKKAEEEAEVNTPPQPDDDDDEEKKENEHDEL